MKSKIKMGKSENVATLVVTNYDVQNDSNYILISIKLVLLTV